MILLFQYYQCESCGKIYDSKAPWARHMQKHIGEPGIEIPECKKIKYKKWQGHKSIEIQLASGPFD